MDKRMLHSKNPGGRPTKYDEEFHCRTIVELAHQGLSMYEIAVEWEICMATMTLWQRIHEKFSSAYMRARTIQVARLVRRVDEGLENRNFNTKSAEMLLRHFGGFSERRALAVKGISQGDFTQKASAVLSKCEDGSATPEEAKQLMEVVATAAKIEEVTELKEKLEKLEEQLGGSGI